MAKKRRYFGQTRNHRRLPADHQPHSNKDADLLMEYEKLPPLVSEDTSSEMAAEFAYAERGWSSNKRKALAQGEVEHSTEKEKDAATFGWFALIFSIIAMFIWPFWMGIASVALAYVAYKKGSTVLGGIAALLGIVAISLSVFAYFFTL